MKAAAVEYVPGKWMQVLDEASAASFSSWPVTSKAATTGNDISLCCLFCISQCNSEECAVSDSLIEKTTEDKQGRMGGTVEKDVKD